MEHTSASGGTSLELWRKRENLLPGAFLVMLALAGWTYTAYQVSASGGIMGMGKMPEVIPFLSGWVAMMVAMMLPATLPLILLYRVVARSHLDPAEPLSSSRLR